MRKSKQRKKNEQRDSTLLCFGKGFSLSLSLLICGHCEACRLVFADGAGLCSRCLRLCFIAGRGQGGQMLGSPRSSLQTHPRAPGSGGEDRTETHFCFYNVVLLSFCFSFSLPLLPFLFSTLIVCLEVCVIFFCQWNYLA